MKRVLVVEDNPDNLELIRIILERSGYAIIAAATGEEGVALAVSEGPDFILMDINLPGIDGLEATRRIRASSANGSVPVNVDSAGVATASLDLNCTIPATGASAFTVTGGGSRTINAPAAVGGNAPDIGVSCVRQAGPVTATLTCAQTAMPGPDPMALTAAITCPLGTVEPNYVSTPPPGGTITANAVTGQTATGALGISNTGTATLNVSNCAASAGFTITSPMFPAAIPPGGNTSVVFTCVAPGVGVTDVGTLTCDHDATNVASPATYELNCTGRSAVVPAMTGVGTILLAALVIGLGLLGMGLRRQA